MATNNLIEELRLQIETDILEYGWILQLARDCYVHDDNLPVTAAVYQAVATLLDENVVEIGDAREVDGRVVFCAWPEGLGKRKIRLSEAIDRLGVTPELGEGFWIAKTVDG